MSWRDEEIDELFRDAADQQSFEFRSEYFKDIEKQLPIKRSRKPFFWWFTSSVFLVTFMGWGILEGTNFEQKRSTGSTIDTEAEKVIQDFEPATVKDGHTPDQVGTSIEPGGFQKGDTKLPESSNDLGTVNEAIAEVLTINPSLGNNFAIPIPEEPMAVVETSEETVRTIDGLALIDIFTTNKIPELIPSTMLGGTKKNRSFYLEVGGGIGQGWVSTDPATVNGNVFVNGGIGTRLGKFNLTAGLGMRSTKLGDLQIMERTKIYGLGYSTYENQYTFQSFYSIEAPVNVNYQMGRHAVGVGILPSFNLCTGLTRTEWIDGVQIVQRSGVSNVGLFSKIGMAGTIGYAYSVNEHTQIGARGAIQFIEPLSSDRFVGTRVKMPFEGQVYLRRTFNFRK